MYKEELAKIGVKTDRIEYGFTDFNGNTWTKSCVDLYNRANSEVEYCNPNNKEKLNFYLDQRHRVFVDNMDFCKNRKQA